MDIMEFTGKTTEEALIKAQAHYGLPLDQLQVEVVSAGSGGLFGFLGAKKARIRVQPSEQDSSADQVADLMRMVNGEAAPEKPCSRPRSTPRTETTTKAASAAKPEAPATAAENRPTEQVKRAMAAPKPAATPAQAPAGGFPRPQRSLDRERPARPEPEAARHAEENEPGPEDRDREEAARRSRPAPEPEGPEVVALAKEALERMVAPLDSEAKVEARPGSQAEGGVVLDIDSPDVGVLIGRRGQTLDALQYLVTRIVSHKEGRPVRLEVDAGSYRRRRQESLEDMARRMADKAREAGKPVSMGPLNSQDRRVVHMALRGLGGIATMSRGRGEMKKVVIQPR